MGWLALLIWAGLARAGELAGVTMPDTATVGGQTVVLNGLGLREKFYVDVYVGGLYLPTKTHDPTRVIEDEVPKRVRMQFILDEVPRDKVAESFYEGLAKYPQYSHLKPQMDLVASWLVDFTVGDVVYFDYVPGVGTTVTIKGKKMGTIPGAEYARLVFNIYVGPNPANEALKKGMLGL